MCCCHTTATLAATFKPSCCHMQTLLLPHANPLAATCKPSCCHMQTLLLPHTNPLAATCKPSCCHTSTLFLPHINLAAATYQQNLAACCYTLAATHSHNFHDVCDQKISGQVMNSQSSLKTFFCSQWLRARLILPTLVNELHFLTAPYHTLLYCYTVLPYCTSY